MKSSAKFAEKSLERDRGCDFLGKLDSLERDRDGDLLEKLASDTFSGASSSLFVVERDLLLRLRGTGGDGDRSISPNNDFNSSTSSSIGCDSSTGISSLISGSRGVGGSTWITAGILTGVGGAMGSGSGLMSSTIGSSMTTSSAMGASITISVSMATSSLASRLTPAFSVIVFGSASISTGCPFGGLQNQLHSLVPQLAYPPTLHPAQSSLSPWNKHTPTE